MASEDCHVGALYTTGFRGSDVPSYFQKALWRRGQRAAQRVTIARTENSTFKSWKLLRKVGSSAVRHHDVGVVRDDGSVVLMVRFSLVKELPRSVTMDVKDVAFGAGRYNSVAIVLFVSSKR